MRSTLLLSLTLVLVLLAAGSAAADNLGRPMSFQYYPARANQYPTLQADGDITSETPALLRRVLAQYGITSSTAMPQRPELFLTSRGGDLSAGMEIGRIIRQYRLNTKVGAHEPVSASSRQVLQQYGISLDEAPLSARPTDLPAMLDAAAGYHPSYCASSCTVAFLGGVARSIVKNSAFAVHQYSMDCKDVLKGTACSSDQFLAAAQRQSADLATYLEAMGVAEAFLTQMVLAEPKQVNVLSEADLLKYRIVYIPSKSQWDVKGSPLGLILVFDDDVAGYKTHLELSCTPRGASGELTLLIIGDHYYDRNVALSAQNIEFSYYPDATVASKSFSLAPDEVLRPPYAATDAAVGLIIRGTPRIVDALKRTGVFSVTSYVGPEKKYVVFASVGVDRDKLGAYITSCRSR